MYTALRLMPALGIVAYILTREVLDRTTDLAWFVKVLIALAVSAPVVAGLSVLSDRLAPRFRPGGGGPRADDARRR